MQTRKTCCAFIGPSKSPEFCLSSCRGVPARFQRIIGCRTLMGPPCARFPVDVRLAANLHMHITTGKLMRTVASMGPASLHCVVLFSTADGGCAHATGHLPINGAPYPRTQSHHWPSTGNSLGAVFLAHGLSPLLPAGQMQQWGMGCTIPLAK